MTVFNGKYATAKVFTDVVDEESISQLINLANQEFTICMVLQKLLYGHL